MGKFPWSRGMEDVVAVDGLHQKKKKKERERSIDDYKGKNNGGGKEMIKSRIGPTGDRYVTSES